MADGFHVDTRNLDEFVADLEKATARFDREATVALAKVGTLVGETAKGIASEHGSKSIPGAIHGKSLPNAFELSVDGEEAPVGALWELGNRGSGRSARTFRHPVFGNRDVWVEQEKHPFLAPARARTRRQQTELLEGAYDAAFKPYGMRPEKI